MDSDINDITVTVRPSGDSVLTLSQDGLILSLNPSAKTLFNLSSFRPNVTAFAELFEHPQQLQITHALNKVIKNRMSCAVELQNLASQSTGQDLFEVTLVPLDGLANGELNVAAVVRDLSDYYQEHEQLRLVIEQAPNALIITDEKGVITMTNAQADSLFGYVRNELVGESINILVPDNIRDKHPQLREQFFKAPQARAMGAGRDLSGRRKDGSEVPVEIGLNPIISRKQQLVVASVVDITERKRAQQQLEKINTQLQLKNQEMEQFIYTVSHDLKSPLVTIGGFSKNLSNTLAGKIEEKQQHQLERIQANVNQMEGLLNDLLQLSRVIRQGINPTAIDTAKLIKDVLATGESTVAASQAAIVLREPLLPIYGNERLVFQCVQNLISNAIKYGDPSRALEISVETARKNDYTVLRIVDNGIGIDEKYHKRIFNIFERLDVGEGTGVGLAIVKTIMDKHAGKIELKSEPGRGSTFSMFFPDR